MSTELEFLKNGAEYNYKKDGYIAPFAFIFAGRYSGAIPLVKLDRAQWPEAIKAACEALNADAYGMITEAWISKINKEDPLFQKIHDGVIQIRDLPLEKKQSVIWAIYVKRDGETAFETREVEYVGDGEYALADNWNGAAGDDLGNIGGRMVVRW